MTIEETKINYAPLVSVLIPCYNHETYIIGALESVAASDYRSIELILIDDASADNSYNLATKWIEDNKARFVKSACMRHEKNRGICVTLNELISLSSGEYINYLASDDNLLPDGLTKQVNFALRKDADFVFSDLELMDETGELISDSALKYFGKNGQRLKGRLCLVTDIIFCWEAPWNKTFIKSAFMKKIGPFDESLKFEDRDLILRVLINGSFEFMYETTTAYRIRLKNRGTPGLSLEEAGRGMYKANRKNYLNSSGIIRLLLGIVVYSYEESYKELGIKNVVFISRAAKLFGMLKRFVSKMHRALMW